jgi:hypothetical protein
MPGVFELRSPADLLAKLGRELERLRTAPNDVDHAFNFFVTAEHMLDWLHPGNKGKARRLRFERLSLSFSWYRISPVALSTSTTCHHTINL